MCTVGVQSWSWRDSKSELIVPQGREVWARLSAEGRQGKYTPKITGLVISFY